MSRILQVEVALEVVCCRQRFQILTGVAAAVECYCTYWLTKQYLLIILSGIQKRGSLFVIEADHYAWIPPN